jgi:hypothetical protein
MMRSYHCPIIEIFISIFFNNLKIITKVDVIIIFKNKDTLNNFMYYSLFTYLQ